MRDKGLNISQDTDELASMKGNNLYSLFSYLIWLTSWKTSNTQFDEENQGAQKLRAS